MAAILPRRDARFVAALVAVARLREAHKNPTSRRSGGSLHWKPTDKRDFAAHGGMVVIMVVLAC
jgi:hypothetical protein